MSQDFRMAIQLYREKVENAKRAGRGDIVERYQRNIETLERMSTST